MTVKIVISGAREGMIIEWPLNGLFHERRDVSGVDDDANDNELSIFTLK